MTKSDVVVRKGADIGVRERYVANLDNDDIHVVDRAVVGKVIHDHLTNI